jgi:hypothetical protein
VLHDRGFETYANLEQRETGAKPKEIVHFENVKGLEVSDGAAGHVLVLSAKKKVQRYQVSSADDAKNWGVGWDQALKSRGIKVSWKVQPGTGQAPAEQVIEGATTIQTQVDRRESRASRASRASRTSKKMSSVEMHSPEDPVLCEGDFELSKKRSTKHQAQTSQGLHFRLFRDRLEYAYPADVAGAPSLNIIMLSDVEDVDVEDTGFGLQMKDGSILTMMADETVNMERWTQLLAGIFEERQWASEAEVVVPELEAQTTEEFAFRPSRRSISAVLEPPAGQCPPEDVAEPVQKKLPLHQGPLLVQRRQRQDGQTAKSPKRINVVLYQDRFEHIPDNAPARVLIRTNNVHEVRVQDAGFILGLEVESFQMEVPPGEDIDPWVDALWAVFDPDSLERPVTIEEERITDWVGALAERPLCHGPLGFQEKGKMAIKYGALFEDRIDIWDGEETPAVRALANDKITLEKVWSIETVFSGFILNFIGGKRLGVHIQDANKLRDWSSSLANIVLETGPANHGFGSDLPPMRFSRTDVMDAKPMTRTTSANWLPRVATLASTGKKEPARKSIYTMRAEGKQLSPSCMDGGAGLHGNHAKVMVQAGKPGGRHIKTHVSEKVNECLKSPRLPRSIEGDRLLANKVTCSTPALVTFKDSGHRNGMGRKLSPRQVGAPYAVDDTPHCPPSWRPVNVRRPSVTGKVTATAYEPTFSPYCLRARSAEPAQRR